MGLGGLQGRLAGLLPGAQQQQGGAERSRAGSRVKYQYNIGVIFLWDVGMGWRGPLSCIPSWQFCCVSEGGLAGRQGHAGRLVPGGSARRAAAPAYLAWALPAGAATAARCSFSMLLAGNYRHLHTRLRANAESVAFYGGIAKVGGGGRHWGSIARQHTAATSALLTQLANV